MTTAEEKETNSWILTLDSLPPLQQYINAHTHMVTTNEEQTGII